MTDEAFRKFRARAAESGIYHLFVSLLIIVLLFPAWSLEKSEDEDTLRNAANVLQGILRSKSVPQPLLDRADCVIVLPGVKRSGIAIGGGGRGTMSCRAGENFRGAWSPPAMYSIGRANMGVQVNRSPTDLVLLVVSKKGVEAVLQSKAKLGKDATASAGPTRVTGGGRIPDTDVLTYGRASGLFAGMSLGGAILQLDVDANRRLYGKPFSPTEIVRWRFVNTPAEGEALISLLNTELLKHSD